MAEALALFAAFSDPRRARRAVDALREHGHHQVDVLGPHADPELGRILAPRPSRLPLMAGGLGLAAAATGYLVQVWTAYDYPLQVSGFELFKFWPYVPLSFISGILAAGLVAMIGFVLRERLPRLHATIGEERCLSAVGRGAWVLRLALDPDADAAAIGDLIERQGPLWHRVVEVAP